MSEQNITIPKKSIDFNCDLAQSFGVYKNETDLDLLDYMSSVNISCGFHSGDPLTMKKVIQYCKNKNKVIGAHIGFPDIQGFGYRNIEMDDEEIEAVEEQVEPQGQVEGVVDGEDTQDVEQDGAHGEPQADLVHLSTAGGRLLLTAVGEHQQRQNDGGEQLR